MAVRRVCVFSGSSLGNRPIYADSARQLGQELAQRRIGLVYGGASVGLMGVLADTVLEHGGEAIGVIPEALVARELAHRGLTDLRVVSSMHQRKALMADLADAFLALPGGCGTLDELFEIVTWAQLGLHSKPIALLNSADFYEPLLAALQHASDEGFLARRHASLFGVAPDARGALDLLISRTATQPD